MRVLVPRYPLEHGVTARNIVFEVSAWDVWQASGPNGAARPLWRSTDEGPPSFVFPDTWTDQEVRDYAIMWNKEMVDLDLTEPEQRVLVGRLPVLVVASVPDVETS